MKKSKKTLKYNKKKRQAFYEYIHDDAGFSLVGNESRELINRMQYNAMADGLTAKEAHDEWWDVWMCLEIFIPVREFDCENGVHHGEAFCTACGHSDFKTHDQIRFEKYRRNNEKTNSN